MTSQDRRPRHTGGCQCGAVRYALYAEPEDVHICHCRMCQKAVAGPFAPLAPIRRRDFAWTRGAPAVFLSSSVAERGFCARCGTPLSFAYGESEWLDVTLGSLDDPAAVPPRKQYGLESRLAYLDAVLTTPGDTTDRSMAADRRSRLVNRQHPDHDTPADWTPPDAEA